MPLLAAACGQGIARDGIEFESLPTLTLVEELRIGHLDDPEKGFSIVSGIEVGSHDRVYVLERLEGKIRVYDHAGALLNKIGGQGSGPGEFELPSSFGLTGDSIWVYDSRLRRVTVFTTDGDLVTTLAASGVRLAVQEPSVSVRVYPHGLDQDRLFVSSWAISGTRTQPAIVPRVRFDWRGEIVDTISWDTLAPPDRSADRVQIGPLTVPTPNLASDGAIGTQIDYDQVTIERRAPGSGAGSFSVTRTSESGDTVYHTRFAYHAEPLSAAAQDTLLMPYVRAYAELGTDTADVEATVRRHAIIPKYAAPISTYRVANDGTLWLRREERGEGSYDWLLIRPDGTPWGVLRLSRGSVVRWSRDDLLWVVEPDRFDVPWIVRYRIEESSGP